MRAGLVFVLALAQCVLLAAPPKRITIHDAAKSLLNTERAEVVSHSAFPGGEGVALKAGVAAVKESNETPDLTFVVDEPVAGRFLFSSYAAVDDAGVEVMKVAQGALDSLFAIIQVEDQTPVKRVVFVPWSRPEFSHQKLGIFRLAQGRQKVKVWLPDYVKLNRLYIRPYAGPPIPDPALTYTPSFVPPNTHPRVWVTRESLPKVVANLEHPENKGSWDRVRKLSQQKLKPLPESGELDFDKTLEEVALARAFRCLVENDQDLGRSALDLMTSYISRLEFGNILDITREIGRAIYTASCIYDWCYHLSTPSERELLGRHLIRLAESMECGWPPFRQSIVNGHGNEAQINRDLFTMGIALYNEDPAPYNLCAYRLLEELVPMRKFMYQSPRHCQGLSYAGYRLRCELHGAMLFRIMTGREAYDPNIKDVAKYWPYMRLPNGTTLCDGDGASFSYYRNYRTMPVNFMNYCYSRDPVIKGEFLRIGGNSEVFSDPILFLLLNDPDIKAERSMESLPLTMDFGPVLSHMVARTDWLSGAIASNSVVAEVKGGGYHFSHHQHADAGAIQFYYRGAQITDLGLYGFYGTPYDMAFNKRSIAHSMLLVRDPDEEFFPRYKANDGGTRYVPGPPETPDDCLKPEFSYGRKIACGFGPDTLKPDYSYHLTDLTTAYSRKKLEAVFRSFCFLRLNDPDHPACAIVLDDVYATNPEFKKYWQVNTRNPPQRTASGATLHNSAYGLTGRVDIAMLRPEASAWRLDIKSGDDLYDIFGYKVSPPVGRVSKKRPELYGHRLLFSPTEARGHDTFLVLIQAYADGCQPLPYKVSESDVSITLRIADKIVCMARGGKLLDNPVELALPSNSPLFQVIMTGVKAGKWRIDTPAASLTREVAEGNHTLSFQATGGVNTATPL